MPLGMEVALGPNDIVLNGNPAHPHQKGAQPPVFGHVCCGQTAGWIRISLGTEVALAYATCYIEIQLPMVRGTVPHPTNFWRMYIVAKRSPISANAELVLFKSKSLLANRVIIVPCWIYGDRRTLRCRV